MSKKKKIQFVDTKASFGNKDYFGTVFVGMLKHSAYKKLSLAQKQFYSYCRVQSRSSEGQACLYNFSKESGIIYSKDCFVFPASHMKQYGIDRGNGSKLLKQLEAAGFIRTVENNKHRKKINVYEFSDEWKNSS